MEVPDYKRLLVADEGQDRGKYHRQALRRKARIMGNRAEGF
jgi:hypothetical protein